MAFNRASLKSAIRIRLEEFATTVVTDADLNQEIDLAVEDLTNRVDFPELLITDISLSTKKGVKEYEIPIVEPILSEQIFYTRLDGNETSEPISDNLTVLAQTFTTGNAYSLSRINLKLHRTGEPLNVNISLRNTDGSGLPYGIDIVSATINGNDLTDSPNGRVEKIDFVETPLLANTKYAIVVSVPNATVDNTVSIHTTDNLYAFGNKALSIDGGVTFGGDNNVDYYFETFSNTNTPVQTQELLGDIRKILELSIDDAAYAEVPYSDRQKFTARRGITFDNMPNGDVFYLFGKNLIGFVNAPAEDDKIVCIDYYRDHPALSDSENLLLPDITKEAIVVRAYANILLADETIPNATVTSQEQKYEELLGRINDHVQDTSISKVYKFNSY